MAETWSVQELLSAGWSEADLSWEAAAERTADAVAQQDYARAKDEAGRALQLARAEFEPIDPRLGTSLANYGLCLHLSGDSGIAPLFREARGVAACRSVDRTHGCAAGGAELALSYAHGGASPRYLPGEMAGALAGDRRGGEGTA